MPCVSVFDIGVALDVTPSHIHPHRWGKIADVQNVYSIQLPPLGPKSSDTLRTPVESVCVCVCVC